MPGGKHKYDVEILGNHYPVLSRRDKRHVELVAKTVDEFARQVLASRHGSSSLDAAILAALNFADAYMDEKQTLEEVKQDFFTGISGILKSLDAYLDATTDNEDALT